MARSKVVYYGTTLMDITDTTAVADKVLSGYNFYSANGIKTSGSLNIITYYTGTTDPSSSTGSDGDIYLKVVS